MSKAMQLLTRKRSPFGICKYGENLTSERLKEKCNYDSCLIFYAPTSLRICKSVPPPFTKNLNGSKTSSENLEFPDEVTWEDTCITKFIVKYRYRYNLMIRSYASIACIQNLAPSFT